MFGASFHCCTLIYFVYSSRLELQCSDNELECRIARITLVVHNQISFLSLHCFVLWGSQLVSSLNQFKWWKSSFIYYIIAYTYTFVACWNCLEHLRKYIYGNVWLQEQPGAGFLCWKQHIEHLGISFNTSLNKAFSLHMIIYAPYWQSFQRQPTTPTLCPVSQNHIADHLMVWYNYCLGLE